MLNSFEEGFLTGILIGEGHFGGDGKQAQITLRMHVRHARLFSWLMEKFPNSKLYGPYRHDNRHYYQWMARGKVLKDEVLPILMNNFNVLDEHIQERINNMCLKYNLPVDSPP